MTHFNRDLCFYQTHYFDKFVSHVVWLHRNDPHFVVFCNVDGCEYSTKRWGAFKTHVSRKQRVQAQNQANECDDSHDTHSVSDDGNATLMSMRFLKMSICQKKIPRLGTNIWPVHHLHYLLIKT